MTCLLSLKKILHTVHRTQIDLRCERWPQVLVQYLRGLLDVFGKINVIIQMETLSSSPMIIIQPDNNTYKDNGIQLDNNIYVIIQPD
jgi:hypothetical protein